MLDIQTLTDVDISAAGVLKRRRARAFARQDRAARLVSEGMKPRDVAQELGTSSDIVRILVSTKQMRDRLAEQASVPHPDPASLALTDPETDLLRAIAICEIDGAESGTCSPKTWAVSQKAGRKGSWAATVGRKRLDSQDADPPLRLVRVAGNGYVTLTNLGWSVAAALFPEIVAGILPA